MTKFMRSDEELVELLWQDGNVIMHKQTNRRSADIDELDRDPPSRCARSYDKPDDLIQEDETVPWFPYNLYDPLERELCSEFFYGVPSTDHVNVNELDNGAMQGGACAKFGPAKETSAYLDHVSKQSNCFLTEENIFPLKSQAVSVVDLSTNPANASGFVNSCCPSNSMKTNTRWENRNLNRKTLVGSIQKDAGQSSSTMTKVSSKCGSNHVVIQHGASQALRNNASSSREITNAQTTSMRVQGHDATPTITSSSGGSGSSIGKEAIHQTCSNQRQKRKQMDTEDTGFQSEDGEEYSIEPSKQDHRSASMRRSRSAEVHNLSERRRRDRINEKLKVLQDLIPHCSKTDKASVLDEAIEYLKSLQLQVQFMWMGSGMAQMMLPNLQHYFSSLSMGMAHGSMTPVPGSIQMPRVPMFNPNISSANTTNQEMNRPFPIMGPVNNSLQMQNAGIPNVYARYLGFHQMQSSPQVAYPTR